ncbi:YhgE/Pip domain-containing protein [Bacillus sp. FJAT-50079]|uniref:YhgE/Pip domain-containing protein n=1 Tax=Bacillus sp. FJAT-50079 TaxID=2833577 RepID=UPI001BCA0AFB|nr:YhgE/Pip domain-containing protein [Bacillus sp. FJAT-50079]MBS4210075.1 YhgE/Pip domain-containing protein [Bacillus sp. FJAT-50079]
MRNIWSIYTKDLKQIVSNWAALILISGLIILPSLYAWLNIAAMWDPYSKTGNLPVAIVNEDKGAVVQDKSINIGKELEQSLRTNPNLEWHFTDRKRAMEKVEFGEYFAMIVIPEDFSEDLSSVISDHPEKAKVEYYVNEKINSISPKITEKGASVIVDQMSRKFISTVSGILFERFNKLGIELEQELPDIERFENYVFILEKDLPEINSLLRDSLADANSAERIVAKAQGALPEVKQLTMDGLETLNKTANLIQEAENSLNQIMPKVRQDIENVQKISNDIRAFINNIENASIDLSDEQALQNKVQAQTNGALQSIETVEAAVTELKEINGAGSENIGNEQLGRALQETAKLKEMLLENQENLANLVELLNGKGVEFQSKLDEMKEIARRTPVQLDTYIHNYKEIIEPAIVNEIAKAKKTLAGARDTLETIQSAFPQIEQTLAQTKKNLGEGKDKLQYVYDEFPYISEKVIQLANKIRNVENETDVRELIKLLKNNPEAESNFFEEPVELDENKLFPIKNYGTGMTPFYTVLAIWVGALLLISLLAVDIRSSVTYTEKEIYFGRLLTFITIGFLQTLIVTVGDLLLLGVTASSPLWLIAFGLLTSLVFMIIVYTLVSVFGNVGKAMAIIILVLQIAGSGGTYPVVLLPSFFQWISPFLPFTYAVDLMREAVGGIIWKRVWMDIGFLSAFSLLFVCIGTILKEPLNRRMEIMLKKSKESGIFH